jgi:DNA-cytosine methyltransferase
MTKPIRPAPKEAGPVDRIQKAIKKRGLDLKAASLEIGVTLSTLQGHLRGEHVRSDSARKYENWLAGKSKEQKVFVVSKVAPSIEHNVESPAPVMPPIPIKPWLVVDVFSGCGGLSLGFDLLGTDVAAAGRYFKTVLAIDNQAAPVAVLNRNAAKSGHRGYPIGHVVDLTEFGNETEFLAFYLQHTASLHADASTLMRLDQLAGGAFRAFRTAIATADERYLSDLASIRGDNAWRRAFDRLDRQALIQTSVIAFHDKLRLPKTGTRFPTLPTVLWNKVGEKPSVVALEPPRELVENAAQDWDAEVAALMAKRDGAGKGQLGASARRVTAFVEFLRSPGFSRVRETWCLWRARRAMARAAVFGNPAFEQQLRQLYGDSYPVTVLVGGPPCQGFSRIGRGKIRSLREALVHVHGDATAGDTRNLLFQQYVMVLGSLRPATFLFENVQHFQSTVKANGVEFEATDVLAEAIANMSDGKVAYDVFSRVIDASKYGIPQARQRFFMAGVVRAETVGPATPEDSAANCLSLQPLAEVPLAAALAGLSEPYLMGGDNDVSAVMDRAVPVVGTELGNGSIGRFFSWVRQPAPGTDGSTSITDGHAARAARIDDAAFFALMGPGKRWMDYRVDDAPTLHEIHSLILTLSELPTGVFKKLVAAAGKAKQKIPEKDSLRDLLSRVDGSLGIRLMLEQVSERLGSPHHLLTASYLAKRDGNHGDWVARLDPSRPAKTMVSHMGKDTYGYVHPSMPRTISVREAARIQSFPDWFSFAEVALTDAFRMIGNAVPPLLSSAIAGQVARVLMDRNAAICPPAEVSQKTFRRA